MKEPEAVDQEQAVGPPDFARRRRGVLDALGEDAMVLPAAPPLLRSRDSELRYRPDSELYYLTGFTEPDALLVLRGFAQEDRSILFVRPRDPSAEQWTGARLGPAVAAERIGVDSAHSSDELCERLPGLLAGAGRIHFRLGAHPKVEPFILRALETARRRGARTGTGPRGILDPGEILDELRVRKDAAEIESLRAAVGATMEGFRAALAATAPGVGEWELEAALEAAFRRNGGLAPAFATIVGSGTNGCVLHYVDNAGRLGADDLVLVDAGAEVGMYAGDLTRTFPVSGRFTGDQRAVYDVVEGARAAAIERIRPGATVEEVHEAAVRTLTAGLVELGVFAGPVDELIEKRAYRRFFPHRTSHWLGLDTHDPGDYMKAGASRRLEPGMVLTVEPGLYFLPPGEIGEARPAEEGEGEGKEVPTLPHPFEGIGVRIEDDVLVTDEGAEVLSAALPTRGDEIAALVGEG